MFAVLLVGQTSGFFLRRPFGLGLGGLGFGLGGFGLGLGPIGKNLSIDYLFFYYFFLNS